MTNFNSKIINLAVFSPRWYLDSKIFVADIESEILFLTIAPLRSTTAHRLGHGSGGGKGPNTRRSGPTLWSVLFRSYWCLHTLHPKSTETSWSEVVATVSGGPSAVGDRFGTPEDRRTAIVRRSSPTVEADSSASWKGHATRRVRTPQTLFTAQHVCSNSRWNLKPCRLSDRRRWERDCHQGDHSGCVAWILGSGQNLCVQSQWKRAVRDLGQRWTFQKSRHLFETTAANGHIVGSAHWTGEEDEWQETDLDHEESANHDMMVLNGMTQKGMTANTSQRGTTGMRAIMRPTGKTPQSMSFCVKVLTLLATVFHIMVATTSVLFRLDPRVPTFWTSISGRRPVWLDHRCTCVCSLCSVNANLASFWRRRKVHSRLCKHNVRGTCGVTSWNKSLFFMTTAHNQFSIEKGDARTRFFRWRLKTCHLVNSLPSQVLRKALNLRDDEINMLTKLCFGLIDAPRRWWKSLVRDTQSCPTRAMSDDLARSWKTQGSHVFFTSIKSWSVVRPRIPNSIEWWINWNGSMDRSNGNDMNLTSAVADFDRQHSRPRGLRSKNRSHHNVCTSA